MPARHAVPSAGYSKAQVSEGSHGFCRYVRLNVSLPFCPPSRNLGPECAGLLCLVSWFPLAGSGSAELVGDEVTVWEAAVSPAQPRDQRVPGLSPSLGPVGTFPTDSYFQFQGIILSGLLNVGVFPSVPAPVG